MSLEVPSFSITNFNIITIDILLIDVTFHDKKKHKCLFLTNTTETLTSIILLVSALVM